VDFLKAIGKNNDKSWFEAHRDDYQRYLLEPLRNLVAELGEFMLTIDPHFEITPAINRTISRIYRDTRFSKDKSLFRNNMWITFKRPIKDWMNAPAYFFEITPDSYRYGMGFYQAAKTTMDRYRQMIDEKPREFLKAISPFSRERLFEVAGEKYKRILDESKTEEIQDWYQRRNLYLVCNREFDDRLFGAELVDDLMFAFHLAAPFYHYLWKARLTCE
jgi:uncharacterized protein (TIGR02453 family)